MALLLKDSLITYATETEGEAITLLTLVDYQSLWQTKLLIWQVRIVEGRLRLHGNSSLGYTWLTQYKTDIRFWGTSERPMPMPERLPPFHFMDEQDSISRHVGSRGGNLKKENKLYRLEPELDKHGLMRVGGRRIHLGESRERCRPVILPKDHHVTKLIVRNAHIFLAAHSGREHTLSIIRRNYWIIACRPLIDKVLKECFVCRKVNSKPATQRQGDLPIERVLPGGPPFIHTGVDCFGPFPVSYMRRTMKRYGCIFTCLSSRAVHIETLQALDADAFLNAFVRFTARRVHQKMTQTEETHFIRAQRDLQIALQNWNENVKVDRALKKKGVEWIFHPPMASHMGGVWERQIRSVRKVLLSIIGLQRVDDDRLQTLFCEVEATLNNRPLTAVSRDINDLEALTQTYISYVCILGMV
ncbi:uncharacterized protein LOC122252530 [Penaeus japonicus]|uniref:uncharacterized protein LOC122252530 n=1 Tax=Penaeus japonicus TaxID=27405 RepID=UPI001C70CF86|nr:uncharacterized protein LOC122252530 [Penaeus japonicus]